MLSDEGFEAMSKTTLRVVLRMVTEEFLKAFLKSDCKALKNSRSIPQGRTEKDSATYAPPESFLIKSDFVGINPPAADEIATR